jgi:hypothetical protein
MTRRFFLAAVVAVAVPAGAASVPATNYTDLWDNSRDPSTATAACPGGESGWGITFTQHTSNQVEAVWYTYDPRAPDASSPGNFKPLWLVMPVGSWTSPTVYSGNMYVTLGTPFSQPWAFTPATLPLTMVGTFTFTFTSSSTGTFQYNVAPPTGLPSSDAAFGLPSFSGTKPICRNTAF